MASNPVLDPRVSDAVQSAMAELISCQSWGDSTFVSMPLYYPNGTPVTVKVEPSLRGFRVSDGGMIFRELEQIGAERYFGRNASTFAKEIDGIVLNRSIGLEITLDELAAAIADVADVACRMVSKIMSKVVGLGEAEIAEHLFERLKIVFGEGKVEKDFSIQAPSTKTWEVDAVVHLDGKDAIFHAVSNHHASVYSTSAMFHDIALKDRPPATTAVVRSKEELGPFYNILAQAGNVIEEADANNVYESAVKWSV